jgi:class 3 adenylate cyclase/tetratricopeptide (TPR) repeat protein
MESAPPFANPDTAASDLLPYLPRVLAGWSERADGERFSRVEGTMVSADISGFTRLSEKLARYGKQGAEELTDLLNQCFDGMIAAASAYGGDIIKFGGDALLLLFTGPGHAERACDASLAMRATIDRPMTSARAGRVQLRMSQGVHSGMFALFVVEGGHRELILTGRSCTKTVQCEASANAGQILLSEETAALVPAAWRGAHASIGCLLKRRGPASPANRDAPESPGRAEGLNSFVPLAQRQQIAAGAEGEHRPATIAFLTFSGTDALCETSPAELGERLQQMASATEQATDRYGVHWLATDVYHDGGKFILAAGAPTSGGDDEERMLRSVRDIMDTPIDLLRRAGVSSGHVFAGNLGSRRRRTFTVMGDAVNLAARLMQKANAGQVIASQAVLDRCATKWITADLEPFLVKGKSLPIKAAIVGELAPHTATDVQSRIPFIGREEELATLETRLLAVSTPTAAPVELIGDAGIGKSRLIQELLQRHPDVRAHQATCGQYAMGTPYFAVRMLLRELASMSRDADDGEAGASLRRWIEGLAPELLPMLPLIAIPFGAYVGSTPEADQVAPEFRRSRSHQLVVDLLGRVLPPRTVMVIDEAQWLDDASRDLIAEVTRAAPAGWFLCAAHTEGPPAFPAEGEAQVLQLGPMPSEAIVQLTAAVADPYLQLQRRDVEVLAERSGGNPLFAIELVEAAAGQPEGTGPGSADALPRSLESAINSTMDSLPAADRMLLRRAAVLGARVDLAILAAASDDLRDQEKSRWAGLLRFVEWKGGGTISFRHALFRQVAYEGLSYRRRRDIHQRVGEALEALGPAFEEVNAAQLSLHFDRAGDNGRAWRYSRLAGDAARAVYANLEAAEFYQRAVDNAVALGTVERPALMKVSEALGDVCELAARYQAAAAAYADARRLADQPDDLCRLLYKEGILREHLGRFSDALGWYTRGMKIVDSVADRNGAARLRADLAVGKAGARFRQGRWHEAVRFARQTVQYAERGGNRTALAHALYLLDASLTTLGSAEAAGYRGRALAIYEELGDLVGAANTLNNLGVAAYYEGRWDDSVELYERSHTTRERAGDIVGAAMSTNNLAEVLSDQGHLDQARPEFEAARRTWAGVRFPFGEAVVLGNLGRLEARSGNSARALELLDESLHRVEQLGATNFAAEIRARRVECLLLAGQDDRALGEAESVAAVTGPSGDPVFRAALQRLRGIALARRGDRSTAGAYFDDSVGLAEKAGAPFELAQSLRARANAGGLSYEDKLADEEHAGELLAGLGVIRTWVPLVP